MEIRISGLIGHTVFFTTGKILIKNQINSSLDRLFTTILFDNFFRVHLFTNIQLFGESLSEKVHATIPKGIVGGFEKTSERMTREAMDVCLRVLKESNKSRFDSYSVRNSVLIISHITFRDCRVHIFSDNLYRNSCISNTNTPASLCKLQTFISGKCSYAHLL